MENSASDFEQPISSFLKTLARDSVMADKGFHRVNDLPEGMSLNIPPFLRGKEHWSVQEETEIRQIAGVRIHVERAILRIKTVKLVRTVFPITMGADLNKIWVICSYLLNSCHL